MDEPLQQWQDQQETGQRHQKSTICFLVKFDAAPLEGADGVFRGAQAFRSPSEIVVPLKMSLEEASLSDLKSDFISRAFRRFPHLSNRTVEAFFVSAEEYFMAPSISSSRPYLLRLDACINGDDTLDSFFTPVATNAPIVYEVIAHWSPENLTDTASGHVTLEGEEREENGDALPSGTALEDTLPAPVVYPFAHRCTHARLIPIQPETPITDVPPIDKVTAELPPIFNAMKRKEAARMARRELESVERTERKTILEEERSARGAVAELEEEGRIQTVTLLRLMYDDVPECGVNYIESLAPRQRYPVDTLPLASFPSEVYMQGLSKCAEETTWLSHVFATTGIYGSAAAAKKYKNTFVAPVPADNLNSEKIQEETKEAIPCSDTEEELVRHYADVRRDLLLWERTTFRALTTEMRRILENQKKIDEEIVQRAFLEEVENASILDFDSYAHHYSNEHLLEGRGDTPDTVANYIPGKCKDSSHVAPLVFKRRTELPQFPAAEKEVETTAGAELRTTPTNSSLTGAIGTPSLSLPIPRSPRSVLAEEKRFREALERSKAHAMAALETISLVDKHWHEPVAFKLAKHRLLFDEKGARNAILAEEMEGWERHVNEVRKLEIDWGMKVIRKRNNLVDTITRNEENFRADLHEQQERHLAMLLSLHHLGMER
ncbi:hypothetical protein MOQ_000446 [Trypanosoma cruzi marinkellei]|uniref:Uncharacterized protein n=1 Tax=Trypanosoma cruzi marinkellei TaxID=85056 RepID=K2MVQ5_TRYCR|nr:hypothetical protein MOQ_000446 [Trypanosoma cruzi marinkellei]